MASKSIPLLRLSELLPGQEADAFALLSAKELLTTRDGKPYCRVTFRDRTRSVSFPVWSDAPLGEDCRQNWAAGVFYKLRGTLRESSYGPQLDITRIRQAVDEDKADGFDPCDLVPQSRFDPSQMFDELLTLVRERISSPPLRGLVESIYVEHRARLLRLPAATRNHHAFAGGYLEHVLSVTRNAVLLADRYDDYYPDLRPRLNKDLVVAGAALHDIGKLREIEELAEGAEYTASGRLIGHILQGRDIVREAAVGQNVDPQTMLRLEHIIVSHQRLPEWGSPKPPMTPEALIVHYADDLDAKYHMMYVALRDEQAEGELTSKNNRLFQQVYRGPVT